MLFNVYRVVFRYENSRTASLCSGVFWFYVTEWSFKCFRGDEYDVDCGRADVDEYENETDLSYIDVGSVLLRGIS